MLPATGYNQFFVSPVKKVKMALRAQSKLLPVYCLSVAGYKGIQVDRDINE